MKSTARNMQNIHVFIDFHNISLILFHSLQSFPTLHKWRANWIAKCTELVSWLVTVLFNRSMTKALLKISSVKLTAWRNRHGPQIKFCTSYWFSGYRDTKLVKFCRFPNSNISLLEFKSENWRQTRDTHNALGSSFLNNTTQLFLCYCVSQVSRGWLESEIVHLTVMWNSHDVNAFAFEYFYR